MIEKIIIDHLNERLDVPAYAEMPPNPPDRFVVLDKAGSDVTNLISTDNIAIQSYAESMYNAAELNRSVKRAMYHLTDSPAVSRVQLEDDYNFTDTRKKRYRYQAVFSVTYYDDDLF